MCIRDSSLTEFYEDPDFENIFFNSDEMVKLFNGAIKIAKLEFPVLIQGETGTGKEVLANLIHKKSNRRDKPFVAINCGAIPKDLVESELFGYVKGAFTGAVSDKAGFFEIASGGTIFLDEIAELPLDSQVKILRVLNDGTFNKVGSSSGTKTDVRIIAATHKNLIKQVEKGEFREDLFYRLSVLNLEIKPLRKRKSDLKYLIDVISKGLFNSLQSNNLITAKEFSEASIKVLMEHEWSGNVRELINTLTRIIVLSESSIIQSEFTGSQLIHRSVIGAVNEENSLNIHRKISTVFTETYNRIKSKTTKKTEIARLMGFENYQTLDSWYNKYYIIEKSSDL
ncbi:MAG: sigma-54-dependent Fis family transcriptional regulator [Ignavibacteriaceae bacterium]|nr:sigma-54-dependent Fis family transcriptional regulator [Ignavibacteriaceae bacterium]